MDEVISKTEFDEQARLYKELKDKFSAFEKAHLDFWKVMKPEATWRNTKLSFWREICLRYDEKDLLNCNGDIFYIDDHYGDCYVGRRVLWNLELSKEQYEITGVDEDENGDYYDYEVKVINE